MIIDWIVALLVGALIGWLASLIMHTDSEQGPLANIIIGIIGAALGRWLLGNVLNLGGAASAESFSIVGVLWGVVGAVILIAVLKALNLMGSSRT